MDFCLLFLWCLLGARQTCGGAAGVLERRFWLSPVSRYLGGHSFVLVVDYWEQAELLNLWGGWTFSSEIKRVFLAFLMWWRVAMSGLWVSSFEGFLDVCSFLLIFHVHFLCTWGLSRNLGFFFNKTLTIKKIKKLQREGLHS